MVGIGIGLNSYIDEYRMPVLAPDLPERIEKGEITLPLYADFSRMPGLEGRIVFGMMVGSEGKTRIPVYDTMTKAGYNPDKDLFQAPVMPLQAYRGANFWSGTGFANTRGLSGGGFLVQRRGALALTG